jgi:hypothetical protein
MRAVCFIRKFDLDLNCNNYENLNPKSRTSQTRKTLAVMPSETKNENSKITMKKLILFTIPFLLSNLLSAQIDFSSQTNGRTVFFKVTKMGQHYEAYYWVFGDGQTLIEIGRDTITHTYDSTKAYNMCVYGIPMPVTPADSICRTINTYFTGLNDKYENDLEPDYLQSTKSITIKVPKAKSTVSIHDTKGTCCYLQKDTDKSIVVDIENWTNGIYIVSILTDERQTRFRILVEH